MTHAAASAGAGRLALGTAQFGLDYGIANAGRVPPADVAAILATAAAAGVDTLDTAIAYGDSEAALGDAGVSGWRVITKLPGLPERLPAIGDWVREQVAASLDRLKLDRLEGVLLHQPADLLGNAGPELAAALERIRSDGMTAAVGISIYDPAELPALVTVMRPDIVQAPFNVLDRRLESSGWLARLAADGVRVHVRSAFLQGLLLMDADARPDYFERWRTLLDQWRSWCDHQRRSPSSLALGFALAQSNIERVVVGVDSPAQLDAAIEAAGGKPNLPPDALQNDDPDLLNPSNWRLQ
ncbi:MAG: aldo/keto reductase [Gammaproteobacteria bacterium]